MLWAMAKSDRKSSARSAKPSYPVLDGEQPLSHEELEGAPNFGGVNPESLSAASRRAQVTRNTPEDDIERQAGDPDKFGKDSGLKVGAQTQTAPSTATGTGATVGHKPSPYDTSSTGLNASRNASEDSFVGVADGPGQL
jgi:hypothetical protein